MGCKKEGRDEGREGYCGDDRQKKMSERLMKVLILVYRLSETIQSDPLDTFEFVLCMYITYSIYTVEREILGR